MWMFLMSFSAFSFFCDGVMSGGAIKNLTIGNCQTKTALIENLKLTRKQPNGKFILDNSRFKITRFYSDGEKKTLNSPSCELDYSSGGQGFTAVLNCTVDTAIYGLTSSYLTITISDNCYNDTVITARGKFWGERNSWNHCAFDKTHF